MSVQLTFDGRRVTAEPKQRTGCIGRVQRCIEAMSWLTAGEIAKCVGEQPAAVSSALNKLKHEGRAVAEEDLGPRGGMVWASTSEIGREQREARLREMRAAKEAKDEQAAKEVEARALRKLQKVVGPDGQGEPDWRPAEMAEDYYAV